MAPASSSTNTNARDPNGFVTNPPSTVVRVSGTARDDINGLLGIVISYNMERERYLVHMTEAQSTMAFKKENLVQSSMVEKYRAQWQQLRNDPRVRQKMVHYLATLERFLAPYKLKHVAIVIMVILFILFLGLGILKTIMLLSLLGLVGAIAGQDIVAKKPVKVIIKNFPVRARVTMEERIPALQDRISDRMAVGIVALLALLCFRALLIPTPTYSSTSLDSFRSTAATSFGNFNFLSEFTETGENGNFIPDEATHQHALHVLEKYYNLGYEDGKEGKERGASYHAPNVVSSTEQSSSATGASEDGDSANPMLEEDWDILIEKQPSSRSKSQAKLLSITNAMSLFFLYRTAMELGKEQQTGLFSLGQLFANLKRVEMYRKVLLALSLYNVLRIFL